MANEPRRINWLFLCLESPEVALNDWQTTFVKSVHKWFDKNKHLSQAQYDKLEEIYEEKCQQ